ncbi:hypothetical protein BH11ARM2_BH11ARM2_19810 [soil metagenome]
MQGREKVQAQLFGTTPLSEVLPVDHPLRRIRADFDAVYSRLADAFETNYGSTGNPSVPTAVLLRAFLLKALYSIKSERAPCEQIEMNVGFRWFVGLDWDDKVFDHSTLPRTAPGSLAVARRRRFLVKWCVWPSLAGFFPAIGWWSTGPW